MNYNYVKFLQKCFAIICVTLTLIGLVVTCASSYATAVSVAIVAYELTLPFIVSIALGTLASIIGIAGLIGERSSHAECSHKLFIPSAVIGVITSCYVIYTVPRDAATVETAVTIELEKLFNNTYGNFKYDQVISVQLALECCGQRNVTDWLKPQLMLHNCEPPGVSYINDTFMNENYRKDCMTAMQDDVIPKLIPTVVILFSFVCATLASLSTASAVSLALVIGIRKNTVSTVEWPPHYLNQLVY